MAPLALLLAAALPRVLSLDAFITWDEPMWVYRSIRSLNALQHGDWAGTFLVGHPGVVTMICGSVGIAMRRFLFGQGAAEMSWLSTLPSLQPSNVEAMRALAPFLPASKLPLALLNSLTLVGIYLLVRRLFDTRVAFVASLLVALDPWHIALSRVLHIDAAAASLMLLSLLALLVYLRERSNGWLFTSGVLAGLAVLSKSYALFLGPVAALVLALTVWAGRERITTAVRHLALWATGVALGFGLPWPAMWADPLGTLRGVLGTALGYSATAEATSGFFLGKVVDDPGALFYPVALAFRSTPLLWLGLLAVLGSAVATWRRFTPGCLDRYRRDLARPAWTVLIVGVYACLFVLAMTVAAKKFDRYMLPVVLALDVLAAVGLVWWAERLGRRAGTLLLTAGLLLQGGFVLSCHPHYLAYYNPLAGGSVLAPRVMPLGWGEGMELAADYLNAKDGAEELSVATAGTPGFAPLFVGRVEPLSQRGVATTDYTLLYVADVQADGPLVQEFADRAAEQVLYVRGMPYVWVYPNTALEEMAAHLRARVDPADAVWMDALSPLGRSLPTAQVLSGGGDGSAVQVGLQEAAAAHRRLWYVAYPDSDPQGWIRFHLSTRALELERRSFGTVSVSCYALPVASTEGHALAGDLQVNFGGRLWLAGYEVVDDVVEYRQAVGVTLRWQARQQPAENYAVSLRLSDEWSHLWAKTDTWLLNAAGVGTAGWAAGEQSEGRYLLSVPAGIPPGTYGLDVVLYDAETEQSLPVLDGAGAPIGTQYTLATARVTAPAFPAGPEDIQVPQPLSQALAGPMELLGYGLSSEGVRSGDTLLVDLYWRAADAVEEDYALSLSLRDATGRAWAQTESPLPNEEYPTSAWRPGEVLHVRSDLLADAAVPTGSYELTANLVGADGRPLVEGGLALARLQVQSREHRFTAPAMTYPASDQIAGAAALVGYDLDQVTVAPGDALHVTLYWQPLARMGKSYQVFTHLLDSHKRVWGQRDSVPCCGACPTTSWLEGEFIADQYTIAVDSQAPEGQYHIGVGMYDLATMRHLPATDSHEQAWADDRIILGIPITVARSKE